MFWAKARLFLFSYLRAKALSKSSANLLHDLPPALAGDANQMISKYLLYSQSVTAFKCCRHSHSLV